jgi:glycosyltransferase involved in cell wall biosynthesis
MNVLYDHQIFSSQVYGGISRYFTELISAINNNSTHISPHVLLKFSNNVYFNKTGIKKYHFLNNVNFKGKKKLIYGLNYLDNFVRIPHAEFDIFHPTYYNPYFLKLIDSKPFVLTVYDMAHEKLPEYFNDFRTIKRKQKLCDMATRIIAISKTTKKDLIEIFKIEPSKVDVIYLANSLDLDIRQRPKNAPPKKFILYVGSRNGYKNFDFLVKTIAPILKKRNLYLICTGNPFSKNEQKYFKLLDIKEKVLHFNVSDQELAYLYSKALFFVFPSLYEGFGLPLLEAFNCGCPVSASKIPVFQEIGGNACEFFEPRSSDSLLNSITNILDNNMLRNNLIMKGYKRANEFSWKKCAIETIATYQKALSG